MSLEHLPADLKLTDKVGRSMTTLVPGDTVTFMYEGERRTVLVLDNTDGRHLKGVAKERQGDYRNYLWSKISGHKYAKPFVKAVPVTTVHFEMLPEPANKLVFEKGKVYDFAFYNKAGEILKVYLHGDSVGLECFSKKVTIDNCEVTADEFRESLNNFMAE